MRKKIIILQHGGGELANQLWIFASFYAYCLEKNFDCENYSFFEYEKYFSVRLKNKLIYFIFWKPFEKHFKRRNSFKTRFFRFIYKICEKTIIFLFRKQVLSTLGMNKKIFFLPPTKENAQLLEMERKYDTIYFTGWLFRNPKGLKKYRKEIVEFLRPKKIFREKGEKNVSLARETFKNAVGVHIRQSDYKTYRNGEYFISQERIAQILDEYLVFFNKKRQETVFIIASEDTIEEKWFKNVNIVMNNGNAMEDLYMLSLCDAIIGSNSSFGKFASYLGDKPHIIFQKNAMDWKYYSDKNSCFQDKYSVMREALE